MPEPSYPNPPHANAQMEAALEHVTWVRSLARVLVQEGALADDVAQETWARALASPPPRGIPWRTWLRGILVNVVRDTRRSSASRTQRERAVARVEARGDATTVIERLEEERLLVELVFELDEPYRTTLLRRFFDGLSVHEIAREDDVPESTVHTRLQRGLERLRRAAESRRGRGAAQWLTGIALVPRARPTLLAAAVPLTVIAMKPIVVLVAALLVTLAVLGASRLSGLRPRGGKEAEAIERVSVAGTDARDLMVAATHVGREVAAVVQVEEVVEAVVVVLKDPAEVVVQVLGVDGLPLSGVPVVVHSLKTPRTGRLAYSAGDEGLAVIRVGDVPGESAFTDNAPFVVTLGFPIDDRPSVSVELKAHRPEPIVLQMPGPTGRITIDIVDPGGAPYRVDPGAVNMQDLVATEIQSPRGRNYPPFEIEGRGRVVFSHVALGRQFRVSYGPRGIVRGQSKTVAGPVLSGHEVFVEIEVGALFPHITGRIQWPRGTPAAQFRGRLYATFEVLEGEDENGLRSWLPSSVGEAELDGTFALPVLLSDQLAGKRVRVELQRAVWTRADTLLSAWFVVTVPMGQDGVDVGLIRMVVPPLIASGTVRDAAGDPVDGARVEVLWNAAPGPVDPQRPYWLTFTGVEDVRTDGEGRFEFRGRIDPGEYGIRLNKNQAAGPGNVQVFTAGATDIALVLGSVTTISGSIEVDEGIAPESLTIRMIELSGDSIRRGSDRRHVRVLTDGTFTFQDVRAAEYRLVVCKGAGSLPLAETRFEVADRSSTEVPPINLRGRLRRVRIEAQGEGGRAVAWGTVEIDDRRYCLEAGRIDVIVPRTATLLTLRAPGYLSVQLGASDEPQVVRLQRGLPIDVTLAAELDVLPEGVSLLVGLVPESEPPLRESAVLRPSSDSLRVVHRWQRQEFVPVASGAPATVHAVTAGPHRIEFLLRQSALLRSEDRQLSAASGGIVEIALDSIRRSFSVMPDADALAAALREIRE